MKKTINFIDFGVCSGIIFMTRAAERKKTMTYDQRQKLSRNLTLAIQRSQYRTNKNVFVAIAKQICSDDCNDYVRKNYSNFVKMIHGEREIPDKYILPLEKVLAVRFADLVEDEPRYADWKNGYSYVASTDDPDLFDQMLEKTSSIGQSVYLNSDEFDLRFPDYVLRYRSIKIAKHMVKTGNFWFDPRTSCMKMNEYTLYNNDDYLYSAEPFVELFCEFDDAETFDLLFHFKEVDPYAPVPDVFDRDNVKDAILSSENVLQAVCYEINVPFGKLNRGAMRTDEVILANPCLIPLLEYALTKPQRYSKAIATLLRFCTNFNYQELIRLEEKEVIGSRVVLQDNGFLRESNSFVGNFIRLKLPEGPNLPDELKGLYDEFLGSIATYESWESNSEHDYQKYLAAQNKVVTVKKHNDDNSDEYAFLDLMRNQDMPVQKLLEVRDGYDWFESIDGQRYQIGGLEAKCYAREVVKSLRRINDVSRAKLDNGKVYAHGDLSPVNVLFKNDELAGIINWDSCHVGEEYEDFINVCWTFLGIASYTRDNADIYETIKQLLSDYGADDEFKRGFAGKMRTVMENRLCQTDTSDRENYEKIFSMVRWSEAFVELYAERMTKEIG